MDNYHWLGFIAVALDAPYLATANRQAAFVDCDGPEASAAGYRLSAARGQVMNHWLLGGQVEVAADGRRLDGHSAHTEA